MSRDFVFGRSSRANLVDVHPDMILVVSRGLLYSAVDFKVIEGARDMERQRMLVATGKSKTLNSYHIRRSDGYAYAVDLMAVGDLDQDGDIDAQDRAIAWSREWYGGIADAMYKAAVELRIPIKWGGDFKSWYDGPHFQLGD